MLVCEVMGIFDGMIFSCVFKKRKFTLTLTSAFSLLCFICYNRVITYNFSAHDPQNNGARDWGPPWTLEVAYNVVHSCTHAL